jgi:hypothetical protein
MGAGGRVAGAIFVPNPNLDTADGPVANHPIGRSLALIALPIIKS